MTTMKCTDIKLQLESGAGSAGPKSLAEHLRGCADCREHADELRIRRLLASMPLREADEGFERRVLDGAFAAASPMAAPASTQRRGFAGMAVAAALAVTVIAGLQWQNVSAPEGSQPLLSENLPLQFEDLEPVQLVLNSGRALENVTVTVDLPAHLALKGYADSRHLEWTANLSAGGNKLVLPVQLRRDLYEDLVGAEEEIVVMLEHDGRRKEFRIPVQPALRSSANETVIYTT
jgi:hypothetical protein